MLNRNDSLDRERIDTLMVFQKFIGLRFKNIELLNRALTHRSFVNEDPQSRGNNERLEFLGDAVLGMVAASELFSKLGDKAEGDLARIKSIVVSEETLASIALQINLDKLLLVGKGEERSGGRNKKAILADALEAVFGACFVDLGFEKARSLVLQYIIPEIEKVLNDKHKKDYKTLLQEYAQKWHKACPVYSVHEKTGPDHDRTYKMICVLLEKTYGPASGKTKKEAEQAAAALAYDAIVQSGGTEAQKLVSVKKL